ncbi:M14 family zinc carboxypeptidase [Halomarina ordinaria]|uniref:M14 family zinc carboxypeptidase n=1 Tax=Halomarina ordinaria TaxID=3033939 RepID=A0ABD5U8K3_9EURY|nr:M14 family zinc carboxypeptidase [Halomarina sp. PSRA2]
MRRRTYLKTTGTALLGLAATGTAVADDDRRGNYRPGGPWPGSEHAYNLNAYHTNEELAADLQRLDRKSDRISLTQIGRSAGLGGPIWEVTVGDGDTGVHLINQIHGDEPVGTEVTLSLLRDLALGNSKQVDLLLDELSFTVVPRVNPDGAMFEYDIDDDGTDEWIGRRTNTQDWAEGDSAYRPSYHYATPDDAHPGYDMNRDFNIALDADAIDEQDGSWSQSDSGVNYYDVEYEGYTLRSSGLMLAPEVRAVAASALRADPDYAITHHHQGRYLYPGSGDGNQPPKQTIMSVMPAYGEAYLDRSPFDFDGADVEQVVDPFIDAETSERSLQLNVLVEEALGQRGDSVFDSVTRYGYYPLWGSYLDTVCPNTGAAGLLYEVAGQTDDRGQQGFGQMVQATTVGFMATFEAMADGSIDDVDAEKYWDIPLTGDPLENPHGVDLPTR